MIRVVKVSLRRDVSFAEWARHMGHVSRYVYNQAVSEYLFGGEYMERVTVDVPVQKKQSEAVKICGGVHHVYKHRASNSAMWCGMTKQLTGWRAEHAWVRECPVSFGRGAIQDASVACRRVIDDNSDHAPYRRKDGRIILYSINPPVRKDEHTIHIPGYGTVKTAKPIDVSLDMRSFKIVDVTRYVDKNTKPSDHMFELHIAVRVPVKPHRTTGVIRGIDVGGKHLYRAAGKVVLRRPGHKEDYKPTPAMLRSIQRGRQKRDECAAEAVYFSI